MMGQVWFQLLGTVSHVQFAMLNILPHLLWSLKQCENEKNAVETGE